MHKVEPKWTLEEAVKECEDMEKGEKHHSEDYIAKVGTIRPCNECGKPVDVITYTGFSMDQLSITHCNEHSPENPIKPPFKKCTDKDCKLHKYFDEEKYYNDSLKIHHIIEEVEKLINEVKPRNDSILEYDRLCHLFGHSHPHTKPADYEFWLYNKFIDYMGINGKLTTR